MLYIALDNKVYAARTYKGLVVKLRRGSMDEAQTKSEWMENVKKRINTLSHKTISKNFEKFIKELDTLNYLKLLRCEHCDNNVGACLKGFEIHKRMTECPGLITKEIMIYRKNRKKV
jgi:hypothetical protein